ncbi:hypothetical protein KO519_19715 [Paraglaciecola agarilytica]|uniref:spermine/spermidine synthase domain-containing protein n=1 Tax=Paraglaciecola chathamensis TaxID=368405 RepID=UPI001C07FE22|nr:hypothetical protein [Paraglaciecola agarilytica]MBU3019905.1 hypothetical protein [Paraglaciecola agarilytica]
MTPWTQLDSAQIPNNGGELTLHQRGSAFSIRITGKRGELMNSREFNSEKVLSQVGCAHLKSVDNAKVLVGGLGMGYTLKAALNILNDTASVTVAELIPEVVKWNHGSLGECAKKPLEDPRTQVHQGDVCDLLNSKVARYDAILLDIDNGPEGLTHTDNNWIYSEQGLKEIYQVLHPQGVLAIWSAGPDYLFEVRLKRIGYKVDTRTASARADKGTKHTIFLAKKP